MERPLRIACAAGGTGGHVFPALGIADAIRRERPDTEFLFFGTAGKIEAHVVPDRGYPFRSIWISGFHRTFRVSNLIFPVKLLVAMVQSWSALRTFRPDVVVGTGGYVCGPVLTAASLMDIPTVLHESNSYPGVTTRLLAKRVSLVLTGFKETGRWLPDRTPVETVGTPVRSFASMPGRTEARKTLGFREEGRMVLILGGSQGSSSINRAIDEGMTRLTDAGIQLLWQTGIAQEQQYGARHGRTEMIKVAGFIENVAVAYAAADLVVSRAGASTLAELALLGRPAILVPYPYAAEQHQGKNARAVESHGGGIVIPDADIMHRLVPEILRLLSDQHSLDAMSDAMRDMASPGAADTIAQRVLSHVKSS